MQTTGLRSPRILVTFSNVQQYLHSFFLSPQDPATPPQSPMTKMWCKPLLSSRKQAFLSSKKNDSQIPFNERKSETQRREVCRKLVFQLQSHRIHTYGQPRCGNSTPLRSVAKSGGFCEQARKALRESQSLPKVSMSLDLAPFRMWYYVPIVPILLVGTSRTLKRGPQCSWSTCSSWWNSERSFKTSSNVLSNKKKKKNKQDRVSW